MLQEKYVPGAFLIHKVLDEIPHEYFFKSQGEGMLSHRTPEARNREERRRPRSECRESTTHHTQRLSLPDDSSVSQQRPAALDSTSQVRGHAVLRRNKVTGGRGHAAPVSKGFTERSCCSTFREAVATGLAEFRRLSCVWAPPTRT